MSKGLLTKLNVEQAVRIIETSLKTVNYNGVFQPPIWSPNFGDRWVSLSVGALALDLGWIIHPITGQVAGFTRYLPVSWFLTGSALEPPHGIAVLIPPIPTMPTVNFDEEEWIKVHGSSIKETILREITPKIEKHRRLIADKVLEDQPNIARAKELAVECELGDPKAIGELMLTILRRHSLPEVLSSEASFALDAGSRVALCTIELPEFSKLSWVKYTASGNWVRVSDADRKKASEYTLHALCIRAAYLVAMGDPGDFFDMIAVNARQKWIDPTTGQSKEGIVASLQATKSVLCQLVPENLDAKACFRHLSGIATPDVLNASVIRPIFTLNSDDNRIVANKDVVSQLEEAANLAAMPWEDFEHLVRQLFEWMFADDGVEVKITRVSRDHGVDGIMFDPDPIRGGKYVLQAKRYTRTVDVAAVRDLYGTILNEGANRGILVTTASYGRDAYEFAKDKPISLIDGPNLIALLKKHGRFYRIDLEEARRGK